MSLEREVAVDSGNASLQHRYGRRLLALERPVEALPHLRRAVELTPQSAEYRFWLGVAWWAMLDFDRERENYIAALALDPDHLSARLYLAHNTLDRGDWKAAIAQYREVLQREPQIAEALHNIAVAEERLGRQEDAKAAWRQFFALDTLSPLAIAAVERRNAQGDFSHRPWIIGHRQVVLSAVRFLPGTDQLANDESLKAIERIGELLRVDSRLRLHIVIHAPEKDLARQRALRIRGVMTERFPEVDTAHLPVSWFASAEVVSVGERTFHLGESVRFIGEAASPSP